MIGMSKNKFASNILLLLAALVWGMAFAFQRAGTEFVGPFTFVASRYILSAVCLWVCVGFLESRKKKKALAAGDLDIRTLEPARAGRNMTILASVVCGGFLFAGAILQQMGLNFTTAGKAAFLTAMYLLLVPIIGLFMRQKVRAVGWVGIAFGAVGMYFLCITESFTIGRGDLIVFIGAFMWAGQVLSVDHFLIRKKVDAIHIACGQFTVCAILALCCAFIFEEPSWAAIKVCAVPILYSGIISGAIGFTFQILGQKNTAPSVAVLLLSLESVFGVIGGVLLLNEFMTSREILGCVFMFAAVIVAQLPERKKA